MIAACCVMSEDTVRIAFHSAKTATVFPDPRRNARSGWRAAMRERAGISRCVTVRFLLSVQRGDGSWPAFSGDDDGSWTTALAALTLSRVSVDSRAREKATAWLPDTKGREAHRLWRWKALQSSLLARQPSWLSPFHSTLGSARK